MNFRVVSLVVLVLTATLAGAAVPGAGASGADGDGVETEPLSAQFDDADADDVRLEVALQPDGSAEWTVEFWMRLDDDESVEAFDTLEADIESDPDNYTAEFAGRMEETAAAASDATGREMAVDEFRVDTERQTLGPEYGVVRYEFRWDGFAAVDGDELRAGDAISGLYLDDRTQLLISWPEEYELVSVSPEPDDERDRTVVWQGTDTDFLADEPRVTVSSGGIGGTSTLGAIAGAIAVATLGLGAAWWVRRGRNGSDDTPAGSPGADPDVTTEADAADATGAEAGEDDAADDSDRPDPRDELLSNEEQVLLLLEEYDGRMKQQTVVEELDWTDAKTSKVVSGLREEGELESFRLGRENVLSLPDEDPPSESGTLGDKPDDGDDAEE
ncbi:hypothetical protein SAMN05444422_10884 [Halobiforma haloterrestris]|uniref:IclR helix-turn-helix domain-containing protein n=1 Tax=Natronobacterium haloterrestre TaxID=148448 RepID=A0A1I1J1J3_NATHA|nr:DUF4897 domain-containing protein [Halobiforma haloterrestris]SFC42336.1 hypothetical protein SAMN05444422_10884 [Halobiforma haloterrestris]